MIIGIGSTIRRDDAAGIRIGEQVAKRLNAEFVEATSVDIGIVDYLDNYEIVAIIDSIITGENTPGTVVRHSVDELGESDRTAGPHRRNLPIIIQMARESGIEVDDKLAVFTMEILVNDEFGEKMSSEIEKSIQKASHEIAIEIGRNALRKKF